MHNWNKCFMNMEIWRKYTERFFNVENDCDGEVAGPEILGPCCLIAEEEVVINGLKTGKAVV